MTLNVRHGFTTAGSEGLCSACRQRGRLRRIGGGTVLHVSQLTSAANTMLGTNPLTLSGNPARACEAALQTQLDSMNNNKLFVEPSASACTFSTPY